MARTIAERSDIIPILAETFRTHGYEGTSLSVISDATGLGKGSLYHFFPGGKEEMAGAVLDEIESWFRRHVFHPFSGANSAGDGLRTMFASVDTYFEGGGRVCVVGVFALGDIRDRFSSAVHRYFKEWIGSLASILVRLGHSKSEALSLAEEAVGSIQGALILARALDDTKTFKRTLKRLEQRLMAVR